MRRTFVFFVLLLALVLPVSGGGLIVVHDAAFWDPHRPYIPHRPEVEPPSRSPRHSWNWAPLEISSTQVECSIRHQVATTTVNQEFYNPHSSRLEGTFMFPVPKGAQIDEFRMEIDGRMVEAELLAAEKARGIYENIVRKLKDPALLEYSGRDLFKVRIFPIEPRSRKKVRLRYSEVLPSDSGMVRYVFPLNTEKYAAKPIKAVSVKVDIEGERPLKSIFSHSHSVEVNRHGEHGATVGFEASDLQPEVDFELYFAEEEGEFGVSLLTHKQGEEEGYFLLLVSPGAAMKQQKPAAKDITFVLDTSGSMAGEKLAQAKKALLFCVENLNGDDRFDVLRFSTEAEPLFGRLTEAEGEARVRAKAFIEGLKPMGGTAIDEALRKALAVRSKGLERPYLVVFLTDGRPTVGVTDTDLILKSVTRERGGMTRVFCFGIGTDVNTHLLDRITEETKAFSQYVLPAEDLELKVSSFYTKIKEPVLSDLRLTMPDGVRVTKTYPAPMPDLFRGQQLVVAGRYSGSAEGKLRIEGVANGERREFFYDIKFQGRSGEHEFIPRLWATRWVGYLLDEMRLRGESDELRDEITQLARAYGIVTPFTSYLIVEDERRRNVPTARRSLGQDPVRQRAAFRAYDSFLREERGDGAVAGAQWSLRLKQAESAGQALAKGFSVASPAASPNPAATTAPIPTLGAGGSDGAAGFDRDQSAARFVGGRTFYKNGNKWVDARVQGRVNGKTIRLEFGSDAYFTFVTKHPKALSWMSLGRDVEFLLGDVVYEIHAASE